MMCNAPCLEGFGIDRSEIEFDALANLDRRAKREAINVAQPLRLDLEPVAVMTERFFGMHFDRVVARHAVIARVGQ